MPSFETTRFGVLEYAEDAVIELPEGLIGLPSCVAGCCWTWIMNCPCAGSSRSTAPISACR